MAEYSLREQQLLLLHFPVLCELARAEPELRSPWAAALTTMRTLLEQMSLLRLKQCAEEMNELRNMELDLKYLRFVADGIGAEIEPATSDAEPPENVRDAHPLEIPILDAMRHLAQLHGEPRRYIEIVDEAMKFYRRRQTVDVAFDRHFRSTRSLLEGVRARVNAELALQGRSENLDRLDT